MAFKSQLARLFVSTRDAGDFPFQLPFRNEPTSSSQPGYPTPSIQIHADEITPRVEAEILCETRSRRRFLSGPNEQREMERVSTFGSFFGIASKVAYRCSLESLGSAFCCCLRRRMASEHKKATNIRAGERVRGVNRQAHIHNRTSVPGAHQPVSKVKISSILCFV